MIFLSGPLNALDATLVPYIQQIALRPRPAESIKNIFCANLDRLNPDLVESRDDIVQWIKVASEKLRLSGHQVRRIFRGAVELSTTGEVRPLTLNDVIKAYMTVTGRPDEWDLVRDTSLYADNRATDTPTAPAVAEALFKVFGVSSLIPDDGRLILAFTKAPYAHTYRHSAFIRIGRLEKASKGLWEVGSLQVVDWGWPEGLWAPAAGCIYYVHPEALSPTLVTNSLPQHHWKYAGFTLGLLNTVQDGLLGCGQPWRRLV
jgi:hypothetical protein